MKARKEKKGMSFVLTTAFISGVSIFINKFGVKGIDPYLFTGLKNALVAFFLFSLILATKEKDALKRLTRRDWVTLFLIGLVGGSLPFLLFFKGLSLTTAAHASFIHKNIFLFATPLASFFLKERIEGKFAITALSLLLGNAFLLKILPLSSQRGDVLVVLATLLWALENVISKRALKNLSPKIVAFGRMFFGSLLIMVFLALTGRIALMTKLSLSQMSWIILTSIFLLAYVTTWYHGLKYIKVSLATSILPLGGLITSFLSLIFLETAFDSSQTLGIVLITVGVVLTIGIREILRTMRTLKRLIYVRA